MRQRIWFLQPYKAYPSDWLHKLPHVSPDGRFIAVINYVSNTLQIFNFSGSSIGNVTVNTSSHSVAWSSDGRFLAVVSDVASTLQIFGFNGSGNPTLLGSVGTVNFPEFVTWSPDGRYLAVAITNASLMQVFSFSGSGNPTLTGSANTGGGNNPWMVSWSPDGRFIAVANQIGNSLQIFSVNGGIPSASPVGTVSTGTNPISVSWSPDGRYLAVVNYVSSTLQIFSFYGLNPTQITTGNGLGIGTSPESVTWSPDGRFVAVVNQAYVSNTLQIFSVYGGNPTLIGGWDVGTTTGSVSWTADGRFIVAVDYDTLRICGVNYLVDRSTQALSNSIVFGNSAAGQTSDLNVKLLSGANVSVDGIVNYDNTLGYTIFSNDNARFVLKNSTSKIRMTPNTVVGWNDRSLIKNTVGGGLGDYNLVSYAPTLNNNIVNYAAAPAELVYDNSNAVVGLTVTARTNSNALVYLKRTTSNSMAYLSRMTSNSIAYLSSNVQVFNTQQVYNHPATIQNFAWYKAGFQVDPGVILALNTPIPVNGQISLGGTLTLSSDLFLEAGATFTSSYGFGEIYGNGNAVHLGGNLAIPSNNLMHIGANTIIEGDGNTVNIGNNSQIFVDDNVTLTLRNVVISNNQNFANNPPIELATSRSKLVLDNARLNFVNDFYFNQGELFCYNDVNFTGTSSFIYRSTVPSQIMSGANLKFNPKTTFYFEPATSGVTGLLAKDLLMMGDATSKLTLDGASLKTTLTGMRLTNGQLLLSNNVTMTSATSFRATGTSAILTLGTGIANAFREIDKLQWSPDGRKLAVAGQTREKLLVQPSSLSVYLFSGTTTSTLATVSFSVTASGASWSPDGQYLAAGGKVNIPLSLTVSTSNLQIYSAANNFSSPVVQTNLGTTRASYTGPVSWSPDGRYLAVGGNMRNLTIYQFNGSALSQVSATTGVSEVLGISWHPSGKYIAIATNSATANSIAVYSVANGVLGGSPLSTKNYTAGYGTSVAWSPDGNYLATTGLVSGTGTMYVYSVNSAATTLTQISVLSFGTSARTVKWSSDGRFLLVGGNDTASRDLILYIEFPSLTFIQTISFGTYIYSTDVHPNGLYLAAGGYTTAPSTPYYTLNIASIAYGQETTPQAISNSIVFGNSAAGSVSDLSVQLLSGANVSVDGILNYDNTLGYTMFSNDNARFVLKNSASEIRMTPNTVVGWKNSSLIDSVAGIGQGDYNLLADDANFDKILPFQGIPNTLTSLGWNVPANTIIHIDSNTVINGNGNTINLGNNSELFVDDNVTLTLRNVIISNAENFVGNPAIKLSSNRSQLTLDNSRLDLTGDFYFGHGQLFVNNDVKFTGTSALVYRSPKPLMITSGGRLFFDVNTTFSVAPATFTDCPYSVASTTTTNNFVLMADQTSQLNLNGCSFFTTLTGLRLTKGTVLFDNKVTIKSNASADLATTNTSPVVFIHSAVTGANPYSVSWSPDGRFIAVVNYGQIHCKYLIAMVGILYWLVAWVPEMEVIRNQQHGHQMGDLLLLRIMASVYCRYLASMVVTQH